MRYVYHLARWAERNKSLRCPQCGKGRGCFKEYVDEEGNPVDPVNHTCGKCDHERSCGYHLTPADFHKAHPDLERKVAEYKERPPLKRIEIPRRLVAESMNHYGHNKLVRWLNSLPWTAEQREQIPHCLFMYAIGTSRDGGTIWWQADEEGIIRTGKKIVYDDNGHRLKDEEGNSVGFNWVHAVMRRSGMFLEKEYDLVQCLFGQHLIKNATKDTVMHIVESEKTALIMAIADPEAFSKNLWLASGGLYNLTPMKLDPLTRWRKIVYPDSNGIERWTEQIKGIPNCELETKWMKALTKDDPQGADIADIVVRRMTETPEARLQRMTDNNPIIQDLIDKLNLIITSKR